MIGGGVKGGLSMGISGGSTATDLKEMIQAIMTEMAKQNKFIHKSDIYTMIQGKCDYNAFEGAIERLCEDGLIYTAYDKDVYALN